MHRVQAMRHEEKKTRRQADLVAVSGLRFGLGADRVIGGDEVGRTVGEIEARGHRRVVDVHRIRILVARVPATSAAPRYFRSSSVPFCGAVFLSIRLSCLIVTF